MVKDKKDLSFEESLKQLEIIVKDLENGNIDLDNAISKFNDAMLLANTCNNKLKNAEDNINKILNKDGELQDFKIEE